MEWNRYAHLQHMALVEPQRNHTTVSPETIFQLQNISDRCLVTMFLLFCRWDYIKIGDQYYKDMDRVVAFERALLTWANWVDTNIDPSKTMVFFQGISPSHYK